MLCSKNSNVRRNDVRCWEIFNYNVRKKIATPDVSRQGGEVGNSGGEVRKLTRQQSDLEEQSTEADKSVERVCTYYLDGYISYTLLKNERLKRVKREKHMENTQEKNKIK